MTQWLGDRTPKLQDSKADTCLPAANWLYAERLEQVFILVFHLLFQWPCPFSTLGLLHCVCGYVCVCAMPHAERCRCTHHTNIYPSPISRSQKQSWQEPWRSLSWMKQDQV